mmetsp:Transcript_42746/g.84004  ORF Transcript_42746/g.84004 Transcript_42746/m.84004 type:complete len:133 (+) Transcript_42746:88-486(+)
MFSKIVALSLIASASAFAPTFGTRSLTRSTPLQAEFVRGDYDDKLYDHDAKKAVYAKWDPAAPRSGQNYNPFETFNGNSPDASGVFPGEPRYKDPTRGDVSFAIMMVERADLEAIAAAPKPGSEPGCAGCKN